MISNDAYRPTVSEISTNRRWNFHKQEVKFSIAHDQIICSVLQLLTNCNYFNGFSKTHEGQIFYAYIECCSSKQNISSSLSSLGVRGVEPYGSITALTRLWRMTTFYTRAPGSDTEGNLFPHMTLINWLIEWLMSVHVTEHKVANTNTAVHDGKIGQKTIVSLYLDWPILQGL